MARRIELSRGKFTLVDDADYERVSQYKWSCDGNGYACRMDGPRDKSGSRRKVLLHRFIVDAPDGYDVDHANRNILDNRRRNLRLATRGQNIANSPPKPGGSSKFKGVWWHKRDRRWIAEIRVNGINRKLGSFKSETEAAKAYDAAAYEAWGEFAWLNFPHQISQHIADLSQVRDAALTTNQRVA